MLETSLKKHFGFNSFKKGQQEVISRIVEQQSAVAVFPTGAGKSLCYQLPAMLLPHMTLVVSPLLSLMKDQLDFLLGHHIPAARLDSTLDRREYNDILQRAKGGELKILMISVERFKNERFRFHLQRMQISLLVVDEAHCISEWGHNFRPEYLKLPVYRREFQIRQTLLMTATATEQVIGDMCSKFGIARENVIATGFYRPNLFLQITPTAESEKKMYLLNRIYESPKAPTIVYVTLQKTAEDVAGFLCAKGVRAAPYHAGMKNGDRESVQQQFMAGKSDCVVATIAFGMGIDKENIRRIIHYDLPKSVENYSQEIGRSGRDGQHSLCELLANRDNISVLENFVYGDTPEKEAIYQLVRTLKHHPAGIWEVSLYALSAELNIRILPLKTLLVYLDMEGIIRPKFSRFEEYSFKYNVGASAIIEKFRDERRAFVRAIFHHCRTKKVWTHVDMDRILGAYATNRQRIITALEYFDEKGWIELQARRTLDAYDIVTQEFNAEALAEKMFRLFLARERHEIQRIHHMADFFESNSCISKRLAAYFGEHLETDRCGHCSCCKTGAVTIERTTELQPLSAVDMEGLIREFANLAGDHFSATNLTKFLCGISAPVFTKLRLRKKWPHFGRFERYRFADVRNRITDALQGKPEG